MENGRRETVQAAGVEEWQDGDAGAFGVHLGGHAEVDRVPERHAVGVRRALGAAGRAGGVHDGPGVVVVHLLQRRVASGGANGVFVRRWRAAACGLDYMGDVFRKRLDDLFRRAVMDHDLRGAVGDDEVDLRRDEAEIQRQEDRADLGAGGVDLHHIGGVHRENSDPVAPFHSAIMLQMRGEAAAAVLRLRVGEFAGRMQVSPAGRVGPRAGVIGEPVVVAHVVPPFRRFCAAFRRSLSQFRRRSMGDFGGPLLTSPSRRRAFKSPLEAVSGTFDFQRARQVNAPTVL